MPAPRPLLHELVELGLNPHGKTTYTAKYLEHLRNEKKKKDAAGQAHVEAPKAPPVEAKKPEAPKAPEPVVETPAPEAKVETLPVAETVEAKPETVEEVKTEDKAKKPAAKKADKVEKTDKPAE